MKKFKLFKMLAVLIVLITSINTAWAERGWRATGMWQIWGWKTNYENNGWITNNGNLFNSDEDCSLGVLTESSDSYWFSGIAAKTYGTEVDGVKCYWVLPGGSNGNNDLGTNDSGHDRYWEYKNMWDYSINKNAAPGDYTIDLYFKIVAGGNEYSENHRKITWTIPGFKTDNPTEFDFGSNSPINKKSVAKIGVVHYGDYPNLGGCVLSGDDKDYFEVIDIDYSGVTVMFKPTAAGVEKTATLTITDTYSKTWTVSLRGTGAANTTTTRMYFNDKTNQDDWSASGALYRFTCEYTSGVYTWYPMEKCENSEYNYYADVELKSVTPTVDRYNPSSPYTTWNYVTPSLSSSNNVAVSTGKYTAYATSLPFNEISGGHVYYDNSESDFSNTLYWVIGHEYARASGSSSVYSKTISPSPATPITNTKLSYYDLSEESWTDASYYAVIGTDASSATISGWGTGWGRSTLSTKGTGGYTAAYVTPFDFESGEVYMASAASSGGAMTITKRASSDASALNSKQTIKYALSTDNGAHYNDMSGGYTPGQISITSYKFVDETYDSVTDSTATIGSNTNVKYSTFVHAAYTGTTTLSASARDGYTFVDWNGSATTLNPKAAATYTARFKANQYTLSFNDEGATTAGGNSNRTVTFEQSTNLGSVTCPKKEGYTFNGYWTTASGDGVQVFAANGSLISTASGYTSSSKWVYYSGNVTLHARWTDDGNYYFKGGKSGSETDWDEDDNWTKGVAPSDEEHNVILLAPIVVPTGATTTVSSVKIATDGSYTPNGELTPIDAAGKLTIPAEAMLVVTNGVQNYDLRTSTTSATTAASLHIEAGNTTDAGNGALVWGSSGTPGYATVDFCTKSHGENSEDDINQYIGTPFSNNPTMLSQYYNSWMYKITYTSGVPNWDRITGDATLNDFEGYNLITAYDAGTTYSMQGQLASNADVTLNTGSTPALVYNTSVVGDRYKNENVLANSWVAPILIKKFDDGDFSNVEKSIYIFNAGSPKDAKTAGAGEAGNYTAYSIATIKEAGTNEVIPSMQSFSVYTSGASPSLTLDYSDLVQTNASNSLIEPNLAPKRYTNDKMDLLKVRVEGDNGWADVLKVYIREDFSTDFEDGWDAHKMYGYPQAPQLYAVTTDGAMAINCVPTAENNVIGFIPGSKDDEYTFSFEYDGNEDLYLKDNKTGIETPINDESSYSFTASKTDGDMRFVTIKKSPAIVTGIDELNVQDLSVQKILHNGALYIIRDGRIYNAEGMLVK